MNIEMGRPSPAKAAGNGGGSQEKEPMRASEVAADDLTSQRATPIPGMEDVKPAKRKLFRRPGVVFLIGMIVVAGVVFAVSVFLDSRAHESTDDAFIDAHVVAVSPKVAGRVGSVHVKDNETVKKGDLIIEIDPRDFEASRMEKQAAFSVAVAKQKNAQASLDQARAHIKTLIAAYASTVASVEASRATANQASDDLKRSQQLRKNGVISPQDLVHAAMSSASDDATLLSKQKEADAAAAYKNEADTQVASAEAQFAAAKAEVSEAKATLDQADLTLSYTKIYAPDDGRITNKSVEAGAYVQVGQELLALVPMNVWVTANFKETQLDRMRPGQAANVRIDAYPGKLYHGHVDSIQAGSGAQFSLLPPENATGNFVKVVQRVPVKIVLDEKVDEIVGPGMSVAPEVTLEKESYKGLILAVVLVAGILGVIWFTRRAAAA